MRNLVFIVIFLLFSQIGVSQKNADVGLILGGASYLGDINTETPFRSISPAAKVFYRRNIHSRIAVRGNIGYTRLSGNDQQSDFSYQLLRNEQFTSDLMEVSGLFEFNFFRFELSARKKYVSPYVGAGIGFSMVDFKFASKFIENFNIPFGLGVKVGLGARFAVGIEYTLNRTFRDDLDQISDWKYTSGENYSFKQRANPQNDDWFSFFGVILSYKLKDCVTCPAYL